MPRLLASYPLSWILAMGTSADAGQAELLFDLLENDGAARITLGPLDLAAQVALVGDVLGAIPDQGLIELAADAAGNPLVLAEAFRGLRDENAIVVRGGHASLAPAQVSGAHLTSPIEARARHRLKGLSVRARRFVETASILGSSSRLEDVGEMLGESPGAMLAALDEALSAYLLMVRADGLAFRHEFIRQAVARMLAEPIQQALHGQFGQMLLPAAVPRFPRRTTCSGGPRPGDAQALAGLDRAVTELAPFAPQAGPNWRSERWRSPCRPIPAGRPARPPRSGRSRRQASGTRRRPWSGRRSRYRCLRARARRCGARWRRWRARPGRWSRRALALRSPGRPAHPRRLSPLCMRTRLCSTPVAT